MDQVIGVPGAVISALMGRGSAGEEFRGMGIRALITAPGTPTTWPIYKFLTNRCILMVKEARRLC